ncbi:MAG: hypothetical protein LBF38_00755, partial [Deltaproteobacteria bacterium]|nr:hypothetical protein [Deltaproteobacteria bacterium]
MAVEQEYVDSGLVEQHPNVALAASEELAAQATKTDQIAQASVPAKPEPQAPASSLAPAASVAPAAPAAAEVELDFWGRPKSPAPTLDQAPPTEPASPLAAQAGAKAEPKVQEPQAQEPKVLEGAVKDDPFSSLVIHETSEVMSEISPKAASLPTFDHMPSRGEAASIKPDQTGKPAKPTEDVSVGPDLFGQTIDQEPRAKETTLEDIVVSAQGPSAQP